MSDERETTLRIPRFDGQKGGYEVFNARFEAYELQKGYAAFTSSDQGTSLISSQEYSDLRRIPAGATGDAAVPRDITKKRSFGTRRTPDLMRR
jgi:hypothetical protein